MASFNCFSTESRKRQWVIAFAIVADEWTLDGNFRKPKTMEKQSYKIISTDSSLFNAVSLEVRVKNLILYEHVGFIAEYQRHVASNESSTSPIGFTSNPDFFNFLIALESFIFNFPYFLNNFLQNP